MAHDDKLRNKIDEGAGRVKETAGRVTGDEKMRQEGETEADTAKLKDKAQDAVEAVKDVFKK